MLTTGMLAADAKAINVRVVKNYYIRGPYVVFEVEYLWNGSVKKNGVNANVVVYDSPNLKYHIDFAFCLRLSEKFLTENTVF